MHLCNLERPHINAGTRFGLFPFQVVTVMSCVTKYGDRIVGQVEGSIHTTCSITNIGNFFVHLLNIFILFKQE
jgi:hypothetical protein